MSLLDYERCLLRYLFGSAPEPESAAALGDPARLALYRGMAQRRMLGQARAAYGASQRALGEAAFAALFARYLAEAPPRHSALREAVAEFGSYAQRELAQAEPERPWLAELALFESLLFRCAYAEAPPALRAPRELHFEGPPLFAAPLFVLRAQYPVQRLLDAGPPRSLSRASLVLWVHRNPDDRVLWRVVSPLMASVAELAARAPAASLRALVQESAALAQRPVDEGLLAELADGLTSALSAGVLLGTA